jgi:cell division protein ZapA
MSDTKGVLDVNILGRSYKVACEEEERAELKQAVAYLDHKMAQVKLPSKVAAGSERVAIMAALNIAHEFLSAKAPGFDIGDLKRRITAMEATLDQALAPQDRPL